MMLLISPQVTDSVPFIGRAKPHGLFLTGTAGLGASVPLGALFWRGGTSFLFR